MSNEMSESEIDEIVEQGKADLIIELENELGEMRAALYDAQTENRTLDLAIQMLKKFIVDNGFDPINVGDTFAAGEKLLQKKAQDLTKEELREKNEYATMRQAGRHAFAKDKLAQPTYEELQKIYEEKVENTDPNFKLLLNALAIQKSAGGKSIIFAPQASEESKNMSNDSKE